MPLPQASLPHESNLALLNSLTRKKERFEPLAPPRVTVYTCGPTVYNHVHIGNWSSFLLADTLVRWLDESGYEVEHVMNITDVEDKIIRDSRAAGESLEDFTARWTRVFTDGMHALGMRPVDDHPQATNHVDGMVEMIQKLLDREHAYLADDGSIYFRVQSFPTYGELLGVDPEQLLAGASGRVSADEYEKDAVADFALWKGYVEADGDVFWEPTFRIGGEERLVKGRPGWHIECSVMSTALLGNEIDIHLGGEDLAFPHHQNEIAQTEGATGHRPFVRYWMHKRHLMVNGAKMSKSKGTFYTLQDVLERYGELGVRAFRYLVVSAHYAHQLDFSWQGLEHARATLRKLDDAYGRMRTAAGEADPSDFANKAQSAFQQAMDDDLQASEALAAVHTLVGEANRAQTNDALSSADAAAVVRMLQRVDRVFGLNLGATTEMHVPADVVALLEKRAKARADKDFAESDRIRDALGAMGYAVKDAGGHQELSRIE